MDKEKTNNRIFITTNCGIPQSVDGVYLCFEQIFDEAHAAHTRGRFGTVLAYHVIQSFKPGEIDPILANDVGVEFAERITGGDHDYVVATHNDREHIHNHIIFHAINRETLKHFRCPKRTVFDFRKISDELCLKYGLSVIEEPGKEWRSIGEVYARADGRSTKARIEEYIDEAVRNAYSWDSFVENLKEMGIVTLFQGAQVMFKAPALSNRLYRGRTLGVAYTEAALMARLGRQNLSEFIVQDSLVKRLDEERYSVEIPGTRPPLYLAVHEHLLVDHGTHWRMYLPDIFEGRLTTLLGKLERKVTTQDLYEYFTPPDVMKQSAPARTVPMTRGVSDAQRRYFAGVDRRVEEVREEAGVIAVYLEYEKAVDKAQFLTELRTRVGAAQKDLETALIARQRAQDLEAPTTMQDQEVEEATRQLRTLRTAVKELEKEHRRQAKGQKL